MIICLCVSIQTKKRLIADENWSSLLLEERFQEFHFLLMPPLSGLFLFTVDLKKDRSERLPESFPSVRFAIAIKVLVAGNVETHLAHASPHVHFLVQVFADEFPRDDGIGISWAVQSGRGKAVVSIFKPLEPFCLRPGENVRMLT